MIALGKWQEARLSRDDRLGDLIAVAQERGASRVMAFFDEPWHADRWILRVEDADLSDLAETVPWSPRPDVDLLGPAGFDLLCAASAIKPSGWTAGKLIHCCLNTWGYTRAGELRFVLDHAARTALMLSLSPIVGGEEKAARIGARMIPWSRPTGGKR